MTLFKVRCKANGGIWKEHDVKEVTEQDLKPGPNKNEICIVKEVHVDKTGISYTLYDYPYGQYQERFFESVRKMAIYVHYSSHDFRKGNLKYSYFIVFTKILGIFIPIAVKKMDYEKLHKYKITHGIPSERIWDNMESESILKAREDYYKKRNPQIA